MPYALRFAGAPSKTAARSFTQGQKTASSHFWAGPLGRGCGRLGDRPETHVSGRTGRERGPLRTRATDLSRPAKPARQCEARA